MRDNYTSPDLENQIENDNIAIDMPTIEDQPPYVGTIRLESCHNMTRVESNPEVPVDQASRHAEYEGSDRTRSVNSIPTKLQSWYSHKSFKIIVCAGLSFVVIGCSFTGLFVGKITSCEVLGLSSTILALWMPSPLTVNN
jgi:hypothetical protein